MQHNKIEAYSKTAVSVGVIGLFVVGTWALAGTPKAWSPSWYILAASLLIVTSTLLGGCCGLLASWVGGLLASLCTDLAGRERDWLRRNGELSTALEDITAKLSSMATTLAAVEQRQTDGYLCAYVDGMSGREPAVKRGALHLVPQSPFDQD